MMQRNSLLLLTAMLLSAPSLADGEKRDIFADPQNLKVLSKDISSHELSETMKGFATGVGARCETCHVGEPNTPLHTFDFASDEKAMKRKARLMIKMVQDINAQYVPDLNTIESADRIEVRCVTCHRGLPQPRLIEDVLDKKLESEDVEAVVDEYNQLREQYFGSHSYDFSEYTLPMYSANLAKSGNIPAAIALAKTNTQNFPNSYYSHFVLGELYGADRQIDAAITSYSRAAGLNERAKPFLDSKIAELKSGEAK